MSYKPELVFCGPVTTVSGYGSHARDLVMSLIKMDKFDVKIISINWGDTPMNALNPNNIEDAEILNRIVPSQLQKQPDIWMQCTIPSEFQTVGKYNIGITAGIETNICSPEWIEGCNRMNMVIVPSNHAKNVFLETSYEKRDKSTNEAIGNLQITVPIEVLHEGIRTEIYHKTSKISPSIEQELSNIKEDFAFLFVGHWLKGDFGQDRKDLSGLIYTFLTRFADTKNPPALLLKASSGTFSIVGRSHMIDKINTIKKMINKKILPNIYLLHGNLTDVEMNSLYNHDKVKAFVSFTKGEGYGRPIAEFISSGKPVLVSGWSGHTDFVDSDLHVHLKGKLTEVHNSSVWDTVINKGSSWFTVDYDQAANDMKDVYSNYKKYLVNSKVSVTNIKTRWSYENMHEKFDKILNDKLPTFSSELKLNLPKLNKLPSLKKIDLKPENL